jgi:hypothetical protein
MTSAAIAVAILLGMIFTFIPFSGRAGSEGRLRRGQGWYLDTTPRPEGPLPAYQRPPRSERTRAATIRLHLLGGVADLVLGAVALLLLHAPIVAAILALFGLALIGWAAEGRRINRAPLVRTPVTEHLLGKADSALSQARHLRSEGRRDEARLVLAKAANELRAQAPGSGKPEEVLAKARSLNEEAERV